MQLDSIPFENEDLFETALDNAYTEINKRQVYISNKKDWIKISKILLGNLDKPLKDVIGEDKNMNHLQPIFERIFQIIYPATYQNYSRHIYQTIGYISNLTTNNNEFLDLTLKEIISKCVDLFEV